MRTLPCLAALAALALSAPASAADLPPEPAEPPELAAAMGHEWRFQATLYGWLTAVNGEIGIRGLPPVDVDVTAADLLENIDKLDGALMGAFYATDGTWMVLTDLIWIEGVG